MLRLSSRLLSSRGFASIPSVTDVHLVGCGIDYGAGRRGVDMGPSMVRFADIGPKLAEMGYSVHDRGNVSVPDKDTVEVPAQGEKARYHEIIGPVLADLATHTDEAVTQGAFPITIGGDHCIAAGSMSGVQRARKRAGQDKMGLIWFDAHPDCNTTETSPSGNLHGMPLAALLGCHVPGLSEHWDVPGTIGAGEGGEPCVDSARLAMIGIRDVDSTERANMVKMGLERGRNVFTMRDIDELGMEEVVRRALHVVAPKKGDEFGLSLDIDGVDPADAPGVGTPVPGGVTFRESHLAMNLISNHGGLCCMDIVEVNPVLDDDNRTAILAVDLVTTALGRNLFDDPKLNTGV